MCASRRNSAVSIIWRTRGVNGTSTSGAIRTSPREPSRAATSGMSRIGEATRFQVLSLERGKLPSEADEDSEPQRHKGHEEKKANRNQEFLPRITPIHADFFLSTNHWPLATNRSPVLRVLRVFVVIPPA